MIINCTPHGIDVYEAGVPDVVDAGHIPVFHIPRSGEVARVREVRIAGCPAPRTGAEAVPVVYVEYGHVVGLPNVKPKTWYVVSLVVALALPGRPDLLIPWPKVRNVAGMVMGCRGLARPC